MSTASHQSLGFRKRVDSAQSNGTLSREGSYASGQTIGYNDAYLYALRVAYLAHLLQPRAKRTQHVPAANPGLQRSSTSVNDLMKDFSLVRDSKSTRFPHGFMAELEKRLTGILMGKERRPEYNDAAVKRSFAAFFNAFSEPSFKKRMEKDRRMEDLVLIFFSNATKELAKGKPPGDESWKLMADRHLALFVRLVSLVLKDHDWVRDRPELSSRLTTLEKKLLAHDEDLSTSSPAGGSGNGTTIEVVVPPSGDVKDMTLVKIVGRIFGLRNSMLQSDIDKHKAVWTEKAALQDLKAYQTYLNTASGATLRPDDFDLDEAYEQWKKGETHDISSMMLAIIQASPDLAKSTTGNLPQLTPQISNGQAPQVQYPDTFRRTDSNDVASYVIDQPVDMSSYEAIMSKSGSHKSNDRDVYTFAPMDTRGYYKYILALALTSDTAEDNETSTADGVNSSSPKLLSKQSIDLLNEICLRWRIPLVSRMTLYLDAVREKFIEQELSLDALDAAFNYIKDPGTEKVKGVASGPSQLQDRGRWPLADIALYQKTLAALHMALLRDLFEALQHCYDSKPPAFGPILLVLEEHIYGDPNFSETEAKLTEYRNQMQEGLTSRAYEIYREFLEQKVPNDQNSWEFLHVIELGKAVANLLHKIQKRFRRNPDIMGVNPLTALIETILPLYAQDAKGIVERISLLAKQKEEEIPIEDGFILYGELVEIRRIHGEALPNTPFGFHIEDNLSGFVWRWIRMTEESTTSWVDEALKQDTFAVRSDPGQMPNEDQRHSVSVIDIFSSFNQTIDRIVQLNWDDDLQYAKFMTALSRIVGLGVARYCSMVEQRFSKEMDRLTPEQEAAKTQSTQEKWLAMAKDAWNQKDKIEPFQFYPESFVKLNNIDFAAKQLDKLEHEVNVDACAEVIQKNAPPLQQRQRKVNNYVFTIKIVEAEDLKACDVGGYSDPYVVLGDEYQKRLAKTRIIYRNLNPRWDETVDITTQGPLNVVATVWDWDAMGDHDCVGRASLKLDPSHFGDFLPREYWLDLDTQGRILLRVSMEGERDDIQFYFGKAFRTLKRTERDMTRTITDKLSAYISHCLSRRTLRSLLSKGMNLSNVSDKLSSVSSYFKNIKISQPAQQPPTDTEVTNALKPLFTYFDDNFAIMNQTLTNSSMIMVMTRLWKEVLSTIEGLLVPPLSDKPSQQRQLNQAEMEVVFKWLRFLFDFFHAVDEETGEANGVPLDVLRSPKYFDITSLNFFYFDTTENLIRTSERMASATAARQQQNQRNRLSAPPSLSSPAFGGAAGLIGVPAASRRSKSIMLSRNLGTMRKAKEEKRKEAQAEPNDDMILRLLRMRPEAERYLKDRSRQKERLAAAAAAEQIVKQSLLAGGGRMMGNLPRR